MSPRTRFWDVTFASFIAILTMHLVFPSLTPWRWHTWHFLYLVPLLACACASVVARDEITFGSRLISGLIQASTLPSIFHDNRTAFREVGEVLSEWILFVICYAVVFAVITQGLALSREGRLDEERASHRCSNCGYDLTGNVSGICPECGRPIER